MKTLSYIGNFHPPFSTENDVRKAFEHIGWTVKQLQENEVSIEQVRESALSSDLLLVTGTWDALPLMDMLDVYHDCALAGIPTATLHLDTFWGTSRQGRKWWREAMFHTAYLFTADGDYQEQWKNFGKNHIWLPPAVRHDACHFGTPRDEYKCDVAFVGSNGIGYHEDVWSYRRELVDALRAMCVKNGWSFKKLHRLITSSRTWRQSSRVTPELLKRDSQNRLLARGPRFRVEGEIIRDLQLAVSGLLNPKIGGRAVMPPAPVFLFQPLLFFAHRLPPTEPSS